MDLRNSHLELAAGFEFNKDDWSMKNVLVWVVLTSLIVSASDSLFAVSPSPMTASDSSGLRRPLAGIRWHRDFDQGWAEAKRSNRPLLIYITAPNCIYCEAMKRDTWCDQSIEAAVGQEFVAIQLSPEENANVISRIKVETYPMTLIGIPEGKIVAHRKGYQPPSEMKTLLKSILKPR
jgi:thioredoxin-related protein